MNEKLNIMETECNIQIEDNIIPKMYKDGFTIEQMSAATDKGVEEVTDIIENHEQELKLVHLCR